MASSESGILEKRRKLDRKSTSRENSSDNLPSLPHVKSGSSSLPPSSLGKPLNFVANYKGLGLFCGIPLGAVETNPVLYFPPFASFFCDDTKASDLHFKLASDLMVSMSEQYEHESERYVHVQNCFDYLLKDDEDLFLGTFSTPKGRRADVCVLLRMKGRHPFPLVSIEIKNGLVSQGADPNLQNIAYYLEAVKVCGNDEEIYPFLMITIAGHSYVQAWGGIRILDSNRISVCSLGQPLSLLLSHNKPFFIQSVAVFLKKVDDIIRHIKVFVLSKDTFKHPVFFKTQHIKDIVAVEPNIFTGVYRTDDTVDKLFIKFTQTYGKEVHQKLAEKKYAPRLYSVTPVEDTTWNAVVMSYMDGQKLKDEDYDGCRKFLESEILPFLKENGFVHGDIRANNILKAEGKYFLLDFDWAGEEGKAMYPLEINSQLNWPAGVGPGTAIRYEHDRRAVELLGQL